MPCRSNPDLQFDDPNLAGRVEALSNAALDGLPYGVVQLDRRARVVYMNMVERGHMGVDTGQTVDRDFFASVAPEFDIACVRESVEEAQHTPAFAMDIQMMVARAHGAVPVNLRIRSSAQAGGVWLFIDRRPR